MTFGAYLHNQSPVHRLPAGTKLATLCVVAAALLLWPTAWLLGALGVTCLGIVWAAGLSPAVVARQLRPMLLVLLPAFVAQAAFAGWQEALAMVARCGVLVLLATLVSLTTRATDMMDHLGRALQLLRPLGVNVGKVSLMLTMTMRLVPILADLLGQVREAQQVRGGDRNPAAWLVPLLVKVLRMADILAEALEARGYDPR